MVYKYFTSSSPIYFGNAGASFQNEFYALVNADFDNAPDKFSILEESTIGSRSYQALDVRINRGVNVYTGLKLGDDFKLLIFKDPLHPVSLGMFYYFDNNYWIVYNIDKSKNLLASCLVRRCNNVLRWTDEEGNYYFEYCSIEYLISRPRDSFGQDMVTLQGYIDVYTQGNIRTKKIIPNQRFLFGNTSQWGCYKVFGGGIRNFLNAVTTDNETAPLLMINMGTNYVNADTDDLVLGIADKYKSVYTFDITPTSISGSPTMSFQLYPTITKNGVAVSSTVDYLSSGSNIATVSGSGVVALVTSGSCTISASINNDIILTKQIAVTVANTPIVNYEVRTSPSIDYILQGDTTTFTTYLYQNGNILNNAFIFTTDNDVATEKYDFTIISDNSFSIKNNLMDLVNILTVTATSGSYTSDIELSLRGAW
jgi:hypothetical protein